jgi:hypothetical protein
VTDYYLLKSAVVALVMAVRTMLVRLIKKILRMDPNERLRNKFCKS